jgi:hypothetical protein
MRMNALNFLGVELRQRPQQGAVINLMFIFVIDMICNVSSSQLSAYRLAKFCLSVSFGISVTEISEPWGTVFIFYTL